MKSPPGPELVGRSEVGSEVSVRLWSHTSGHYAAPASAHSTVELAWVEDGEVQYKIGSREIVVRAGEALVVPRDVEHTTIFGASVSAGALALGAHMVAEISDAVGTRSPGQAIMLEGGPRVVLLGKLLREEVLSNEAGRLLAMESLAEAMTVSMVRATRPEPSAATARDPRVLAAIERIHASYGEALAIDDLARAAGMSRFHFSRVFRDAMGASPYQYLTKVRVDRASEMLRSGRLSVTEVALSVGFNDLGRFARSFRAITGKKPSEVAARRRVAFCTR